MMTPRLLQKAGRALYGPHWHAPLAADFNVAKERVEAWATGRRQMPDDMAECLATLALKRELELRAVVRELRRELVT